MGNSAGLESEQRKGPLRTKSSSNTLSVSPAVAMHVARKQIGQKRQERLSHLVAKLTEGKIDSDVFEALLTIEAKRKIFVRRPCESNETELRQIPSQLPALPTSDVTDCEDSRGGEDGDPAKVEIATSNNDHPLEFSAGGDSEGSFAQSNHTERQSQHHHQNNTGGGSESLSLRQSFSSPAPPLPGDEMTFEFHPDGVAKTVIGMPNRSCMKREPWRSYCRSNNGIEQQRGAGPSFDDDIAATKTVRIASEFVQPAREAVLKQLASNRKPAVIPRSPKFRVTPLDFCVSLGEEQGHDQ